MIRYRSAQTNLLIFVTFHLITASYGKKTSLSIIEQRQSLPIFKLKEELLKAVHDNQVLIVIGETGTFESRLSV